MGPKLGVVWEEKQQKEVMGVGRADSRVEREEDSRVGTIELCPPLAQDGSRQRCLPPAATA